MKKIIELASEFLDYDVFAGERTNEIMSRLKPALAEYKRLSETPITEDWLKEHGWKRDDEFDDEWWYRLTSDMYVDIILYPEYAQIRHTSLQLRSLADLYDAMELCGITID